MKTDYCISGGRNHNQLKGVLYSNQKAETPIIRYDFKLVPKKTIYGFLFERDEGGFNYFAKWKK